MQGEAPATARAESEPHLVDGRRWPPVQLEPEGCGRCLACRERREEERKARQQGTAPV